MNCKIIIFFWTLNSGVFYQFLLFLKDIFSMLYMSYIGYKNCFTVVCCKMMRILNIAFVYTVIFKMRPPDKTCGIKY